jgi:hypothetical protein
MKSQIKVDYSGLHAGLDNENKKPVIRINLQQSDDPRDTLLNDLVTPKTVFGFILKSEDSNSKTYLLYAQERAEQLYKLATMIYNVCKHLDNNFGLRQNQINIELAMSPTEYYFTCPNSQVADSWIRSNGVDRDKAGFMNDDEFIAALTADYISEFK